MVSWIITNILMKTTHKIINDIKAEMRYAANSNTVKFSQRAGTNKPVIIILSIVEMERSHFILVGI